MHSNVPLKGEWSVGGVNVFGIVLVATLVMLVPLVAMHFTHEVVWGPIDFAVAWTLLVGTGLTYKLLARKAENTAYRAAAGIAVATALFLVWVNLAVGVIGDEGNPANLMYGGVLAVGGIGAVIARFRPLGMSYALFATALAQLSVGAIALIAGLDATPMLDGFLAALWVGSALLFRRAASVQN